MPRTAARRPPLESSERELFAFACLDADQAIHWVRVFESTIKRRSLLGKLTSSLGRRYETRNGWPVHPVAGGLYLAFSEESLDWIELEALIGD